eukprot:XP_011674186.1 PREDICTED: serine/arginine repetitive matrix protein 2 [Strongylocentrotus purpuratus]
MPKTRKQLDLNTCTVDELESVDGVTRSLAKRIADYRSRAGYFNNINELGKVRGTISEKRFTGVVQQFSKPDSPQVAQARSCSTDPEVGARFIKVDSLPEIVTKLAFSSELSPPYVTKTPKELPRLTTKKFPGLSQKKISPRKDQKNWNSSGDNRRRSRSRTRTVSRSVSRSASPQKGSLRISRSRSGSRKRSAPRSRRRNESKANERLSRSDIENWLQEGAAPLRIDRGEVNGPLASSTPRRRRERRSQSPTRRRDVAGPSRIEDDGRNEPVVLNRSGAKQVRQPAVQDPRRSRKEDEKQFTGRRKRSRDSGSPRRKLDLDDDVGNARGQQHDTEVIDQGIQTTDRDRSRSRGRQSSTRPAKDEGGDELARRQRSREPRHRDSHRRRRHEETASYAMGSWCSIA